MLLPPPHMHLQGRQPRRSLWLPVGTKHLSGGRQSTGSHAKEEGRVATGHGSTQPAEQKPTVQHKARGKDAHEAGTHLGNREGAANAASTARKPRAACTSRSLERKKHNSQGTETASGKWRQAKRNGMGKETREAKQGKAKNGKQRSNWKQSQQTYSEQERNACSKEQDHAKKAAGKTKNTQIGNKDNAKQKKKSLQKKIKIKKKTKQNKEWKRSKVKRGWEIQEESQWIQYTSMAKQRILAK